MPFHILRMGKYDNCFMRGPMLRPILYFPLLAVMCSLWFVAPTQAQSKPAADLIIANAKIWTVDKALPTAQAVAVIGDRIVAVGSDADLQAWRGPRTQW